MVRKIFGTDGIRGKVNSEFINAEFAQKLGIACCKYFLSKSGSERSNIVIIGKETKKLFPTDVGIVVTEFLIENFPNVMEYSFTASVENEFDEIAEGKKIWNQMIANFYKSFHHNVEEVIDKKGKALGERELGKDPETGLKVIARIGPFGPMGTPWAPMWPRKNNFQDY